MKNYKVRDKVSKSRWVDEKADDPRDAAESYCKAHGASSNVEVVDDFGNSYSFNLTEPISTTSSTPSIDNFSSHKVNQKLDELIGVVKHIRLMFFCFVLVVVVVPYVIAQLN